MHPLEWTSQFWNIGTGLDGGLPLREWAKELARPPYNEDDGGSFGVAAVAWLKWQLIGVTSAKGKGRGR